MRYFFYLITTLIFFSSCGVKYKSVPYFTDLPVDSSIVQQIKNYNVLKLQKNDILALTVSSLNPEASAIFNFGNVSSSQGSAGSTANPINSANGFMIDEKGEIQLPLVGAIHVDGLTIAEARAEITGKLVNFLKEPVVNVRLANFKVSILGDVARPGVYPVQNEKISVTEALSLAGDLTITAVRNNVLLIRETQGKRQFIRIDLQKSALFNSPNYFLQNNDILYIQPGTAKYASVDSSYRNVSIVLSALSVIALIISRF
ncbi:polysaccharide biosynthesis/export family protein [Pedobacter ginsengisoli]|uniref:polysaccharide biosynthesis/export family protein n=1 Tax=Pedobacter ginsengisoli TaxID=363852 RepID=UPI002549D720|nr:polysaccharide biosynthesis/export family protein [Pedobacter ginsengisoli]